MKSILMRKGNWLLIVMLLFVMGTGGNIAALATGEETLSPGEDNRIITAHLENGIPLFIQKSDVSRVMTLKVFLKGHAQYTPEGKEGIEKLTLNLLARGSQNYTWEQVQSLLYQSSSSVGPFADYFDYSGFAMNTLDKYYDQVYRLFVDELLRPSWDAGEFRKVKNSLLMARTQKEADPYSLASQVLSDNFFGDHPYQADIDGNLESLRGLTLEDAKAYYADSLTTDRLFFVAVGDYDIEDLLGRLNRDFGSLPMAEQTFEPVLGLDGLDKSTLMTERFDDSPGLAYVRGNFVLPQMDSREKAALNLALALLDDILFQVVRTENSACYSVWANLYDFQSPYGCFGVFKTQVPFDVDEMIWEAVDILASGRCLSITPVGGDPYVPIEEALDFYKAQFVTEYYTDQQTGSSIADLMGLSYLYEGDPRAYLSASDEWDGVTPAEIVNAVERYLVDQPVMWIVLGGEDVIN